MSAESASLSSDWATGSPDSSDHGHAPFEKIARDIERRGFSICPGALPEPLAHDLAMYAAALPSNLFHTAGVGRGVDFIRNRFVRSDSICWITGEQPVCQSWLNWSAALQQYLNRRLLLGLFSFESHFARYEPGDFYRRHYDAFRGESNRLLSLVAYLNTGWGTDDAGELVVYRDDLDQVGTRVAPLLGTVVVFLSEEFPHEVLAAGRERWSIAGWYRRNTSTALQIDPPR